MTKRNPNDAWILCFSGKRFYPFDPDIDDIDIGDIAHALSLLCRFGGHCRKFYSVAQHSVIVANNLPNELKLQGLLHDAAEAYCGDLPRPIKRFLNDFKPMEEKIFAVIANKYGIPEKLDPLVKKMDDRALLTERRDIMIPNSEKWTLVTDVEPFREQICPWNAAFAEETFLRYFESLFFVTNLRVEHANELEIYDLPNPMSTD